MKTKLKLFLSMFLVIILSGTSMTFAQGKKEKVKKEEIKEEVVIEKRSWKLWNAREKKRNDGD